MAANRNVQREIGLPFRLVSVEQIDLHKYDLTQHIHLHSLF